MKKKKQIQSYFLLSFISLIIVAICLSIPVFSQTLPEEKTSATSQDLDLLNAFKYYLPGLTTSDNVSIVFYDENLQKLDEQNIPIEKETMDVKKTANQIEAISRYDQLNDLMLTIGKVSKNQTWQISNAYLLPLSTENVTDKFASRKEVLNKVYTDYVSPYHDLRAVSAIDGDDPNYDGYTGGWHTYDELVDTPTAASESLEVYADGKKIVGDSTFSTKELKIVTTNLVQAVNTKKRNGTGRPVLREKVIYTIIAGKIGVEVDATALEDVTLKDYAFLQAATNDFNNSLLAPGDPLYPYEIRNFTKDIWGSSRKHSETNELILSDGSNQLSLTIDPTVGIGNYQYNPTDSVWFYRSYGKMYFNPIATEDLAPLRLVKGQGFIAKGSYQFSHTE
ncbi:hypothetical protein GUJ14_05440 [Enterococcus hirae]|uniref:hypothetical protein n=1 Tax=Enterococcus hirae TaxID=1354 RepID=UPI000BA8A50B|nr:hypothetical protein [Enterococcus hirae]ASV80983.1 hypothetical protein A6J73_01895 [Enterococcus hirae]MDD9144899.1 hypothetical protein [Enterococcus hirae]MEB5734331.1 hypothetical protein [Enterococcus hirae]MEC4729664.1 hypothetical protein [Enterococcus hirae]NAA12003.1 hypothetical protein [Enterococcus hirae]